MFINYHLSTWVSISVKNLGNMMILKKAENNKLIAPMKNSSNFNQRRTRSQREKVNKNLGLSQSIASFSSIGSNGNSKKNR